MKKIAIALAISATIASATFKVETFCNRDCEQRRTQSFEQIAAALAWISKSYVEDSTKYEKPVVCHDGKNIGSEELQRIDHCIRDCWDHYAFDSQIKSCTLKCTKKN